MFNEIDRMDKSTELNHKELLKQLLHEFRGINYVIKASSDILSKSISGENLDKPAIEYHSQIITENAYLLSLWLDICDLELNPELFSQQEIRVTSIWGKFKKAALSFRRIMKSRNITLNISGESKALLDCFPVMDMLPYILLDNSVKYSPSHSAIEIKFSESSKKIDVEISSMGPVTDPSENEKLFDSGFRADSALKSDVQGYGRGLALAKNICDLHGATIAITRSSNVVEYNGLNYSEFCLSINIPRNT